MDRSMAYCAPSAASIITLVLGSLRVRACQRQKL